MDQSLTHGYVSRFEHTALRPRLHTEGFSLTCPHRTPTQGTSTEDLGKLQSGVHNSSLNRIQPLIEARYKATQTPPHTRGVGTQPIQINHLTLEGFQHKLHLSLEGAKHNLHLSLEGANHNFHNHLTIEGYQIYLLSLEGSHNKGSLQLGGLSQPQTNFFPTKIKILIDRQI